MSIYATTIGADRIAFLTDTGSPWGCAGVLDHVASADEQPDPDTVVFDNRAAQVLRDLPDDCDGHMDSEDCLWFGGIPYPTRAR